MKDNPPFYPLGWNYLAFPPYTGQWWAFTRHGTVEMVDVDLKDPENLGKPELAADTPEQGSFPVDPYVYQYGQGCTTNAEVLGTRRWTHWMPVRPPGPPANPDPVAAGLIPPGPHYPDAGKKVQGPQQTVEHVIEEQAAEKKFGTRKPPRSVPLSKKQRVDNFFDDLTDAMNAKKADPRHPDDPTLVTDPPTAYTPSGRVFTGILHECNPLKDIGHSWQDEQRRILEEQRFHAEEQAKVQEMMDRADASAYDPNRYADAMKAEGGEVHGNEGGEPRKMSPLDLVEASKALAEQLLSMPQEQRESEYRRLKNLNPVMAALVKAAVEEYRRATGQWGKDAA